MATVAELIAVLEECDPKAVVLLPNGGSIVAHAIRPTAQPMRVRYIREGHYSTIGDGRKVAAVILDIEEE